MYNEFYAHVNKARVKCVTKSKNPYWNRHWQFNKDCH